MKFRQRFPPDEPPEAPLTSWALYDGFWPDAPAYERLLSTHRCQRLRAVIVRPRLPPNNWTQF